MPIYKTPKGLLYFAHVPRAAGSSVENHLKALFGAPAFLDRGHASREAPWTATSPQHVTVEDLSRLFPPDFFEHAFAVVRHPVDRLVSVFKYQKFVEGTIANDQDFNSWILGVASDRFATARQHDNHALPQAAFVPHRARVFRIEDGFPRVERYLRRRLEAPAIGSVRRLNASPKTSNTVVVSDASRTLIRELYSEDFEKFGYRLEEAKVFAASPGRPAVASIAVRVAAPSPDKNVVWGEHAFAEGLVDALKRQGASAQIDYIDAWGRCEAGEVDLVIRAHGYRQKVYLPRPGRAALMWNIYPAWPKFKTGEVESFSHVWVASRPESEKMAGETEVMPQCFDARRMRPVAEPARDALVLVANNYERRKLRRIAQWALEAKVPLRIWGKGWRDTSLAPHVVADHLPNTEVSQVYGNALAVLNDHANTMGEAGFPSNRLFDSLACAAPVITDPVAWLPDDLRANVTQVESAGDMASAVEKISATFDAGRAARLQLANDMRETHSFDARAKTILGCINGLSVPAGLEAAE
ncbi:MAG: sulfotransferase family 2 domain-containing protein [Pseudomonadota bacterium]